MASSTLPAGEPNGFAVEDVDPCVEIHDSQRYPVLSAQQPCHNEETGRPRDADGPFSNRLDGMFLTAGACLVDGEGPAGHVGCR